MKKADFRNLRGNVVFNNCTFENKEISNTSINKFKNVIIIVLALIVTTLVVSRYCPELLPDFIRLAIRVASSN